MRYCLGAVSIGVAVLTAAPAQAADALKFGAAPAWVVPRAIPNAEAPDAPVAVLLSDQQVRFDPGRTVTYSETAIRIQNAQGLSAGNISFAWRPQTDTITVNKLHIRRGKQVIDVLGRGQTFTVARRETNLEAAMLDGSLTANIQPEGLQEGDTIDLATTTEHSDPVLGSHVEAVFGAWNGSPIESAHVSLSWPTALKLNLRQSAGLPVPRRSERDGRVLAEYMSSKIQPLIAPKGAPFRFRIGRIGEATDFATWADVSGLFAPLYRTAAIIPKSGPLRDEVERIRRSAKDPQARAEQALALVQNRVRYVALLMGQAGYVPASAEATWSRRFGDCKGKTALLLGLLQELGIAAEPVLVSMVGGDAIADRLPMVGVFNHVLVRARLGGKTFWLDGTRTGDGSLPAIRVPDFGWGLPLVAGAQLTRIVPAPLEHPEMEILASIDASAGIKAPAPAKFEQVIRGDAATALNTQLASLTAHQRDEFLRTFWRGSYDFLTVKDTSVRFDKSAGQLHLTATGDAQLDWTGGLHHLVNSSLGFTPDFERAAGPQQDAPVAVGHPVYNRTVTTIRMPAGFFEARPPGATDLKEELAGVEYRRSARREGDSLTLETSTRSLVSEIPYKSALAAAPRLRALADEDICLRMPANWRPTDADTKATLEGTPASASAFFDRGWLQLNRREFDKAIADFTQALASEPDNVWYLANRGIAHAWKQDFAAAEKDLSAAEKIDPKNPVAMRARGLAAELQGDYNQAVEIFSAALQMDRADAFSLYHRATSYRGAGQYDKALADTDTMLATGSKDPELRLFRANLYHARGDKAGAAREAEQLVLKHPREGFARVAAGRIFARVGMNGRAKQAFDNAIAIKPEAYIYLNRAQSRPLGDRDGRLADLDAALKLDPANSIALAEKAEQLAVEGRLTEAVTLFDKAIAADQDNGHYVLRRANLLYKVGRRGEAEAIFTSRRAKAVTWTDFNNLCWAKATAGILLDTALEECNEAVRLGPDKLAALDSRALVLLRLGRIDDAMVDYGKALAQRPTAPSYMGRAIAFTRKGDPARAAADRTEAPKLDPDEETRFAEYGLKL